MARRTHEVVVELGGTICARIVVPQGDATNREIRQIGVESITLVTEHVDVVAFVTTKREKVLVAATLKELPLE